jgi:hypothetical protein
MHSMALRLLQPIPLLQPTALLQPMLRLHAIPVAPTVDLPVKPTAVLPPPPILLALVRRPIASPSKPMPLKAPARGSGTRVPVRRNEAVNASPTLTSIAVTASEGRARRANVRPSIPSRCLLQEEERQDAQGERRTPLFGTVKQTGEPNGVEPNAALQRCGDGETGDFKCLTVCQTQAPSL